MLRVLGATGRARCVSFQNLDYKVGSIRSDLFQNLIA